MSTASERIIQPLEQVVKGAPVGTNLALLHLLWPGSAVPFSKAAGLCFLPSDWPALQWPKSVAVERPYGALLGASLTWFTPGAATC